MTAMTAAAMTVTTACHSATCNALTKRKDLTPTTSLTSCSQPGAWVGMGEQPSPRRPSYSVPVLATSSTTSGGTSCIECNAIPARMTQRELPRVEPAFIEIYDIPCRS